MEAGRGVDKHGKHTLRQWVSPALRFAVLCRLLDEAPRDPEWRKAGARSSRSFGWGQWCDVFLVISGERALAKCRKAETFRSRRGVARVSEAVTMRRAQEGYPRGGRAQDVVMFWLLGDQRGEVNKLGVPGFLVGWLSC